MGGTGIIAFNESVGRLEPRGKGGDPMGRWSFVHLRRHRAPPITIITVYQVCKQPTNIIGNTAWHQQRRALDLAQRDEHPRNAFMNDLSRFITQLQAEDHSIIIGGDWNETQLDSHSGLAQLALKHCLIDPWQAHYPTQPEVATYEFGTRRIDAVLVSRNLIPSTVHIGYSPVGLMAQSDHRALIIEFDTKMLFGKILEPLPSLAARGVRSKDKQSVITFVDNMYSHLLENNAFHRGKYLNTADRFEVPLAESLDKLTGEAGDIADAKCIRRRPTWFSIEVVQDRLELSHLRHYRNGLKFTVKRDRCSTLASMPVSRHHM